MKITRKASLAVVFACATGAVPGTARALTCAGNFVEVPVDGEQDVPTNTLIWTHGRFGGADAARLIGPDGEVPVDERFMPVAIAPGEGTNFPVLVPRAELQPSTRYAIEVVYDNPESEPVTERRWFTTGTGPAAEAPPPPELVSIEPGAGNGWLGTSRWLSLGFEAQGRLLIADTAAGLGDVSSARDLFVEEGAFESVELTPSTRVVRWLSAAGEVLPVGRGDCLIWPEDGSDRQSARFGALDHAGNFSGWISAELELPSSEEASALIAAQEEEARAQAEEVAELRQRPPRDSGLFANHNTGCSLAMKGGAANGGATSSLAAAGSIVGLVALLGISRRRGRGRRRQIQGSSEARLDG